MNWPSQQSLEPGAQKVHQLALQNPAKFCCLLCTSTNEEFVKAMDQTLSAFS